MTTHPVGAPLVRAPGHEDPLRQRVARRREQAVPLLPSERYIRPRRRVDQVLHVRRAEDDLHLRRVAREYFVLESSDETADQNE